MKYLLCLCLCLLFEVKSTYAQPKRLFLNNPHNRYGQPRSITPGKITLRINTPFFAIFGGASRDYVFDPYQARLNTWERRNRFRR